MKGQGIEWKRCVIAYNRNTVIFPGPNTKNLFHVAEMFAFAA